MFEIGRLQRLPVVRLTRVGAFLGDPDDAVLLPRKFVPRDTEVGSVLRVFVHHDSEDRPVATTQDPRAVLGEIAAMRVVDATAHGAFLDWGLDKDLFVPLIEQHRTMVVGSLQVVAVQLDERTGRLIGSSRLGRVFDQDVGHLAVGQEVELLVYGTGDAGVQVVVDGRYAGLIYQGDLGRPLRVGDRLRGSVTQVRDDHKVDVRPRKPGRAAEVDAQDQILAALRAGDGFLPLHDKSPPEDIARALPMSKRVFKAALGGLYRRGLVELGADGVRLCAEPGSGQ